MTGPSPANIYRDDIECLNRQGWPGLDGFVDDDVRHNGRRLGLFGYRAMLARDVQQIPDLSFDGQLLICSPPHVASRLHFDCTPRGRFLGLQIDGRRVAFTENAFSRFDDGKIAEVWSIIDKSAIEAHLQRGM